MSFIKELLKAKNLKVSHNGAYHRVPDHVLAFNRKLAFEISGIDPESNHSAKDEKEMKKTFSVLMEDYFESQVPMGNPSRNVAPYVFDMFDGLKNSFKNAKDWLIFKAHTVGLATFMVKKVIGDLQSSENHVGLNRTSGMTKKDARSSQVERNQLYQSIILTWTNVLVEDFYSTRKEELKSALDKIIDANKEILADGAVANSITKNKRDSFLREIKKTLEAEVEKLDFVGSLNRVGLSSAKRAIKTEEPEIVLPKKSKSKKTDQSE